MSNDFEKDENTSEEIIETGIISEIPEEGGKPKKGWKKELLEWAESLVVAVVIALIITKFVFCMVKVDGASMDPTLHHKDQLFVTILGYNPKDGDIIVFTPKAETKKKYIKRVIATEGQTVDIKNGEVFVDGNKLNESYIKEMINREPSGEYPKIVPEDHVFVLGDNRNNSADSREEGRVGMVSRKSIMGKALFRVFPFNNIGNLYSNYSID